MNLGNKSLSIAVYSGSIGHHDLARQLSVKLSIPLVQNETDGYDFLLRYSADGLVLKQTGETGLGSIRADFTSPTMIYRLKYGGGRRQALSRAVGLKKGRQPSVIDATAGLGRDGFILAYLGCHVHFLEKSPILAALLEDALERAALREQTAEIAKNKICFTHIDSVDFLRKLPMAHYPDVIYMDPMYPHRTKSGLVKKEMRMLRIIAGEDRDSKTLLTTALDCARNRVVLKRPRLAPVLGSTLPSHQITGKTSRFDVYLV